MNPHAGRDWSTWGMAGLLLAAGCDASSEAHGAPEPQHEESEPADNTVVATTEEAFEDGTASSDSDQATRSPQASAIETQVADVRSELEHDRTTLAQEQASFKADQEEFERRLAGIATLEKRIDEVLGVGEGARRRRLERISRLGKLISAMPPQAAANMLARMADEDAQSILRAIATHSERKASKLLAVMPGDRAASLGRLYLDHDTTARARSGQDRSPEASGAVGANASAKTLPTENPS